MRAFSRMCLRMTDRLADWLRHSLGSRAQLRFGIWVVILSTIWTVAALIFSDEPPNVIAMSGIALILTGVGIVVSAQVLEREDEGSVD